MEFSEDEERFDDSYKKYPTLNLATKNLWSDLKIRSFDDFCLVGAREHSIPEDYILTIESVDVTENYL